MLGNIRQHRAVYAHQALFDREGALPERETALCPLFRRKWRRLPEASDVRGRVHEGVYAGQDHGCTEEENAMNWWHMNWWHTIELPDGTVTPGRVDYRGERGKCFLLPDDLTGKRVLDFGTYDGFWAIEAKKRGARFVMASDRFPQMLETARLALRAYDISYCVGDLDFPIVNPGEFDVVLFYGILYHLKNPFMGLWNAANCCKPGGLVIVETAVNQ